ncbi:MAG TPA: carboxylating nicotinate-nucleotide diphosphorylase [Gemmatimonadales bacterium]|nr:carboxylating nicotinate-nucleotide diphosphorylase [Gemmatimonadales bacterium]
MGELFARADILADATALAHRALAEDGEGDVTSEVTVPLGLPGLGILEVRRSTVLAGLVYAEAVAVACGLGAIEWCASEGELLPGGTVAGRVSGPLRDVLRAERTMLNLLQRASGIATETRRYADAVRHTPCRILHTRKTAPGLRLLDVSAVLAGGGEMHRLGLSHTVMVKDNHWQALRASGRTLADALATARELGVRGLQVEVESREQVEEAAASGATRLLVDNQTPETVREWGALARELSPEIELEATGGITLENVAVYAEAGVNYVSIGALTHSVIAADLSLEVVSA